MMTRAHFGLHLSNLVTALGDLLIVLGWLRGEISSTAALGAHIGFVLFLAKWVFDLIFLLVGHRAHGAELAMQLFVWSPLSAAVTAVAGVIALSLLKPLMEVRTA